MLYGGLKTLRFTMAELLFLSLYFELTMTMMVDDIKNQYRMFLEENDTITTQQ